MRGLFVATSSRRTRGISGRPTALSIAMPDEQRSASRPGIAPMTLDDAFRWLTHGVDILAKMPEMGYML